MVAEFRRRGRPTELMYGALRAVALRGHLGKPFREGVFLDFLGSDGGSALCAAGTENLNSVGPHHKKLDCEPQSNHEMQLEVAKAKGVVYLYCFSSGHCFKTRN